MKLVTRCAFSLSLVILPLNTNISSAHEIAANFPSAAANHINAHGHDNCRALGNSGYTAKVRGILGDGGGRSYGSANHSFNVTTCFKTKKQCNHFLNRIHHKISQIERIHYARCKSRA